MKFHKIARIGWRVTTWMGIYVILLELDAFPIFSLWVAGVVGTFFAVFAEKYEENPIDK